MPLSALAPLPLLLMALLAASRPGPRPAGIPRLAELSALAALLAAAAGAAQVALQGPVAFTLLGGPLPLTLRVDATGAVATLLVAFVGWAVTRFARRQFDGAPREGAHHALILATVAAVLVLAQAGSLGLLAVAFALVGAGFHRLLTLHGDRPQARRAAAKFALGWGAGDVALIAACALLWRGFGTTDIAAILEAAASGPLPAGAAAAVWLLIAAAALKTAAFPLHGWLTEVMEAPTPVSALLHAGIVNAGGLLLIRFSGLIQTAPDAMAALALLGGFTALFGAVVMLTQSAVKTALAWSTVAQMGFMLLQCGLGLWALALLHLVAHSLYKAHAFLGSGGAVQATLAARRPGPVAAPDGRAVARAFGLALLLYAAVAAGFAVVAGPKPPQALALGAILIFGVAYLVAQGLADAAPRALTRRTTLASVAAAAGYFGFHALAAEVAGPSLPAPPAAGPVEWAVIALALASFGAVAAAQAMFPHWSRHPAAAGLRVHLANGFYLTAALDRLMGLDRAARPR